MPAVARCPSCACRAEVHWADPDDPGKGWGCYGCKACSLDYEKVADLIAGRLYADRAEELLEGVERGAAIAAEAGAPYSAPFVGSAEGAVMGHVNFADVEVADGLVLASAWAELPEPLGRMPALVFRFYATTSEDGRVVPRYFRTRALIMPASHLEGTAELFARNIAALQRGV